MGELKRITAHVSGQWVMELEFPSYASEPLCRVPSVPGMRNAQVSGQVL
jgi:hypothetical protein